MPVSSAKALFLFVRQNVIPTSYCPPNHLPSLYSLPILRAKEERTENFQTRLLNIMCKIYFVNAIITKLNIFKCL